MVDTSAGPRRRRGLQVAATALALVVAVAVAAGSARDATVTDVLSIPDLGTVRADRLANGTPVFVVAAPAEGDRPATLDVVQAFTPEVDHPITGLVAWCAAVGAFADAHHGPLYDVRGRRLPNTAAGRATSSVEPPHTALDDLIHRTTEPVEGRTGAGDPVVVGGVQQLQPWQVAERPALDPVALPGQCRLAPDRDGAFRQVVDHSFMRAPLDPDRVGWQVADAWLLVDPDGSVVVCDDEPAGTPPRCADPRTDVRAGFELTAEDVGGVPAVLGGPIALRVEDGVLRRAAVLADSTWRGSSLRGSGLLAGVVVDADERWIALAGVGAEEGGPCRGTFPTSIGMGDTAMRIPLEPGVVAPAEGGAEEGAEAVEAGAGAAVAALVDQPVEVVVDAATCRGTAIRP